MKFELWYWGGDQSGFLIGGSQKRPTTDCNPLLRIGRAAEGQPGATSSAGGEAARGCPCDVDTVLWRHTVAIARMCAHLTTGEPRSAASAASWGRSRAQLCLVSGPGWGPPTGVKCLGSPASPRMVPVDAAACRAYRDLGDSKPHLSPYPPASLMAHNLHNLHAPRSLLYSTVVRGGQTRPHRPRPVLAAGSFPSIP